MKKTIVKCSNCGAIMEIPAEEYVTTAKVIGENSGLGTVYLPTKGQAERAVSRGAVRAKAEDRLEALKNAGVNVANLFAMRGASGEDMLVRMCDGKLTQVNDDDPIFAKILGGGTIPNRELFRRWIMSQVFHMMTETKYWNHDGEPIGFNAALQRKGYDYQFKMLLEELRVQAKLIGRDLENFEARNRWFNKTLVLALVEDYVVKLKKYLDSLTLRHCKGVPYKRIHGRNIFVSDFDSRIFSRIRHCISRINAAKNPNDLYKAFESFYYGRIALAWQTKQCKEWIDAYKGCGAYYTLQNLIRFHGCRIHNLSERDSLSYLDTKARQYATGYDGYRLFALMKETIEDNGIDIHAKMKEWADAKR